MKTTTHVRGLCLPVVMLVLISCWAVAARAQATQPYRLLIAYTPAVSALWADPITMIDQIAADANLVFQNSNMPQRCEVVYAYETNYVEVESYWDMVLAFAFSDGTPSSVGMDEVTGLRNLYRADACMLIVNHASAEGIVYSMYSSHEYSFGVSHYSIAEGGCTHEVGHMITGRHAYPSRVNCSSFAEDGSHYPVKYCHAMLDPLNNATGWRTRMSNPCLPGLYGPLLPYFSSPLLTHPTTGQVLGSVEFEDNRRAIMNRFNGGPDPSNHGNFQNYRTTLPTMTLSNSTVANRCLAHARASTTINLGNGFTVANGARFTATIDPTPFGKRPAEPVSTAVTSGVRLLSARFAVHGALEIDMTLEQTNDVTVTVRNALGRTVLTVPLGTREAGQLTERISTHLNTGGMYLVTVRTGDRVSNVVTVKR